MPGAGPIDSEAAASQISAVAALNEPVRRSLYAYIAQSPGAVGRDEAASAAGISRELAAFHLDKLLEEGLLDVEYRRITGRSGPGAGRPAKLYRPSGRPAVRFGSSFWPKAFWLGSAPSVSKSGWTRCPERVASR